MPGFDGIPKGSDHAREIVGMNGVAGSPTLQLLSCLAKIFQDLAVEKFDLACRTHGTHERRNAMDDQAQIEFARVQAFLGALPVVNIRMEAIPADDATFRVPHGESANLEPAVYAIGTMDTVFRVISGWISAFDRASPRGQHARKVIGMNNVGGGPTFQFVKGFAVIIQVLLTDEFEFAFGCQSMNKAGYVFLMLPRTPRSTVLPYTALFRSVNIRMEGIPADDATFRVPQWER